MALIKCPECKGDVSDKASACPTCGYPIKKRMSDEVLQKKSTSEYSNDNFFTNHRPSRNALILSVVSIIFNGIGIIPFIALFYSWNALVKFDEFEHTEKWQPRTAVWISLVSVIIVFVRHFAYR